LKLGIEPRERGMIVRRLTGGATLSDVEEYLLERARTTLSDTEKEEENPCWWVLSALDVFEGKEAREKYYAGGL
jgi:hypothetical protein